MILNVNSAAWFLLGMLTVAVTVLGVHDQQTIKTLKSYARRLKDLEAK